MTGSIQPRRRRLLHISGAGLVLALFGGSTVVRTSPATIARNSFVFPGAAETLGRAYLSAYPGDRSIPVLVQALVNTSAAWAPLLSKGTPRAVRRFTRKQCRQDFAQNRVVMVDGWLLAATEARLCALAALDRTA